MRCIGVFRYAPHLFQQGEDVNKRFMTNEKVLTNIKPKVGSVSSSQLTEARSRDVKTTRFNKTSDVGQALQRVRNQGCVAPKKKSAITRPVVAR